MVESFEMTKFQSDAVVWGVVGSLISMITIIILSIELIYQHCRKKQEHFQLLNNTILGWQLLAFFLHLITCFCFAFIRTNFLEGGSDNGFNYHPTSAEPYSFIITVMTYIAGKVCTDISWIIRSYATFKNSGEDFGISKRTIIQILIFLIVYTFILVLFIVLAAIYFMPEFENGVSYYNNNDDSNDVFIFEYSSYHDVDNTKELTIMIPIVVILMLRDLFVTLIIVYMFGTRLKKLSIVQEKHSNRTFRQLSVIREVISKPKPKPNHSPMMQTIQHSLQSHSFSIHSSMNNHQTPSLLPMTNLQISSNHSHSQNSTNSMNSMNSMNRNSYKHCNTLSPKSPNNGFTMFSPSVSPSNKNNNNNNNNNNKTAISVMHSMDSKIETGNAHAHNSHNNNNSNNNNNDVHDDNVEFSESEQLGDIGSNSENENDNDNEYNVEHNTHGHNDHKRNNSKNGKEKQGEQALANKKRQNSKDDEIIHSNTNTSVGSNNTTNTNTLTGISGASTRKTATSTSMSAATSNSRAHSGSVISEQNTLPSDANNSHATGSETGLVVTVTHPNDNDNDNEEEETSHVINEQPPLTHHTQQTKSGTMGASLSPNNKGNSSISVTSSITVTPPATATAHGRMTNNNDNEHNNNENNNNNSNNNNNNEIDTLPQPQLISQNSGSLHNISSDVMNAVNATEMAKIMAKRASINSFMKFKKTKLADIERVYKLRRLAFKSYFLVLICIITTWVSICLTGINITFTFLTFWDILINVVCCWLLFGTSSKAWNFCVNFWFYPCCCFMFCKTIKPGYWKKYLENASFIIESQRQQIGFSNNNNGGKAQSPKSQSSTFYGYQFAYNNNAKGISTNNCNNFNINATNTNKHNNDNNDNNGDSNDTRNNKTICAPSPKSPKKWLLGYENGTKMGKTPSPLNVPSVSRGHEHQLPSMSNAMAPSVSSHSYQLRINAPKNSYIGKNDESKSNETREKTKTDNNNNNNNNNNETFSNNSNSSESDIMNDEWNDDFTNYATVAAMDTRKYENNSYGYDNSHAHKSSLQNITESNAVEFAAATSNVEMINDNGMDDMTVPRNKNTRQLSHKL